MSGEKITAKMLYGVRVDEINGRTITLSKPDRDDVFQPADYELNEKSELNPEDLVVYLGKLADVALVNGKIQNIMSH